MFSWKLQAISKRAAYSLRLENYFIRTWGKDKEVLGALSYGLRKALKESQFK